MSRDATNEGLVVASPLLARRDVFVDDAAAFFLETLDGSKLYEAWE